MRGVFVWKGGAKSTFTKRGWAQRKGVTYTRRKIREIKEGNKPMLGDKNGK